MEEDDGRVEREFLAQEGNLGFKRVGSFVIRVCYYGGIVATHFEKITHFEKKFEVR